VRYGISCSEKPVPLVNWPVLQDQLAAADVDALVATTPQNVTYVSDFWGLSHWSRRSAQVFAVAFREPDRRVTLVVALGNADLIPADTRLAPQRVETYGRFAVTASPDVPIEMLEPQERRLLAAMSDGSGRTPIQALVDVLRAELPVRAAIAVETGGLLTGDGERLREELDRWRTVPAEPLLQRARAIKTPAEANRLRAAAQLSAQAFAEAMMQVRAGDTERDLQRRMHTWFARHDAVPFLSSIQSGSRTALPNGQAGGRRLRPGDLVRFDGGCRRELYVSDIARIGVLGEPTTRQQAYYSAVVAGLEAAAEAARPGARCRDVFVAGVQAVRDNGIPHYERSHCGHGIGIENYDLPRVTPDSDDVLQPGMVICLETPYYELGWGGVQAEDTFLVTSEGLERFTQMPAGLMTVRKINIRPARECDEK
jgi:Xaa-Pro dipeptidase